ncbi:MAG: hypothetical protein P8J59_10780, partial [Phycisphaerales bacterium]|nr:hypothetical protein [Phycisphaerales bacterium]
MTRFRFTRRLRNAPRTAAILLACLAPVGIVVAAADDPPAPPATPEPSAPPPKSDPSRIDPARPLPFKILRKSPKGLLVIP